MSARISLALLAGCLQGAGWLLNRKQTLPEVEHDQEHGEHDRHDHGQFGQGSSAFAAFD